jgi:hypothetical protein
MQNQKRPVTIDLTEKSYEDLKQENARLKEELKQSRKRAFSEWNALFQEEFLELQTENQLLLMIERSSKLQVKRTEEENQMLKVQCCLIATGQTLEDIPWE